MTEQSMTLGEEQRKVGVELDGGLLRAGVHPLAQMLMELEVERQIGAAKHQRSPQRRTRRNGYRERGWETRVGEIPLRIPRVRRGSYFPPLSPRRRAEEARLAVVQPAYGQGVSARKVDDLLQALGLTGIDKSKVSRVCKELDRVATAFRERRLTGGCPCVWLDAVYLKVRQDGRIDGDGGRHRCAGDRGLTLGFDLGAGEEKGFWLTFLRRLVRRGLRGVQLVTSRPRGAERECRGS